MFKSLLTRWDRFATPRSRMRHLPPRLLSYLEGCGTILDVGTGDGRLASYLLRNSSAISVTGVDVMRRPDAQIPVLQYDGVDLPFADRSFDMVCLIDVLHHDEDPERLLREALRVAKRRVLVKDHYWISRLDRLLLTASDYLGNRVHGIPLPYNFLKPEQWDALFGALNVRTVSSERFHYGFWDRTKQVIFLIERSG